jgi:hypothetical protein
VDPYRLDEVDDVWRRIAAVASDAVSPEETPYRDAALRVIEARARVTEAKLWSARLERRGSAGRAELWPIAMRLANIRHAVRAARGSLALRRGI